MNVTNIHNHWGVRRKLSLYLVISCIVFNLETSIKQHYSVKTSHIRFVFTFFKLSGTAQQIHQVN